jgi:D-alanine-D-alanine ligase
MGRLFKLFSGKRAAIVFNLVESIRSRGRFISFAPLVLESLGVPYTGCPADAVYLTSNKILAKKILRWNRIATPEWFTLHDLEKGMGPEGKCRFILKSVWEHASVGLDEDSIVEGIDPYAMAAELKSRREALGGEGFAEQFIEGREFNLSILESASGPRILPPAEIIFRDYPDTKPKVVGYRAKWDEGSFEYSNTPRSFAFSKDDRPLLRRLRSMAARCWRIFGLRGYARVDFRVDKDMKPWILEINTNPCLSPDAGFMAAAREAGLDMESVLGSILAASW